MVEQAAAANTPAAGGAGGERLAGERRRVAALPFDAALAEFKAVVEKLEAGNLPLEDSIALFEQGVLLQTRCERLLAEAEVRFQRLVDTAGGGLRAMDLSLGEDEDAS